LETIRDRGLATIDQLQETTHCQSYGHVINDVTVTPNCKGHLRLHISETVRGTWLVSMVGLDRYQNLPIPPIPIL